MKKKVMFILLGILFAKAPPKPKNWDEAAGPVLAGSIIEFRDGEFFYIDSLQKAKYDEIRYICSSYDKENGTQSLALFSVTFERSSAHLYPQRRAAPLPFPLSVHVWFTPPFTPTLEEILKPIFNGFSVSLDACGRIPCNPPGSLLMYNSINSIFPAYDQKNGTNLLSLFRATFEGDFTAGYTHQQKRAVPLSLQEAIGLEIGKETKDLLDLRKQVLIESRTDEKAELMQKVASLEQQATAAVDLQKQIDAFKAEKEVLDREKAELMQKVADLERQAKETATDSQKQLDALQAEKVGLQQQLQGLFVLQGQLEAQEQYSEGLQEQLRALQAEKSVLEQKIRDLEQTAGSVELQKKLDDLQIEKSVVEQKIVILELQALVSAEEQKRLQCENSELIERLNFLQTELQKIIELQRIDNLRPQAGTSLVPLVPILDLGLGMDVHTERAASRSGSSSSSSEDLKKSKNKDQETAPVATAVVEEEGSQPTTSRRVTLELGERPTDLQGQMVVPGAGVEIDEASTSDVEPIDE